MFGVQVTWKCTEKLEHGSAGRWHGHRGCGGEAQACCSHAPLRSSDSRDPLRCAVSRLPACVASTKPHRNCVVHGRWNLLDTCGALYGLYHHFRACTATFICSCSCTVLPLKQTWRHFLFCSNVYFIVFHVVFTAAWLWSILYWETHVCTDQSVTGDVSKSKSCDDEQCKMFISTNTCLIVSWPEKQQQQFCCCSIAACEQPTSSPPPNKHIKRFWRERKCGSGNKVCAFIRRLSAFHQAHVFLINGLVVVEQMQ